MSRIASVPKVRSCVTPCPVRQAAKGTPPLTRTCIMEAMGCLCKEYGTKLASCTQDTLGVIGKQLALREMALRRAAMMALADTLEGTPIPENTTGEAFKIIGTAAKDKASEVRAASAAALEMLAESAPGGVVSGAPRTGALSLETSLSLCVKGLDDVSMAVKLAFANAIAAVLSTAIESGAAQAAERQRTGARVDKMEAAEDKAAQESSRGTLDRGIAKLKEMRSSNRSKRTDSLSSFTLESAFGHLCGLFTNATTRSQRAGAAAAMVALLKRQTERLGDASQNWVIGSVLGLVGNPRWGPQENVSACSTVSYVLRAGISANATEQQQSALLEQLLGAIAGNPEKASSTINDWQLQIAIQEVSHLVTALDEAVAPLAALVRTTCWAKLDHREYSVRFETGTALTALVRAQPAMGVDVLSAALTEMNTEHTDLVGLLGNNSPTGGSGAAAVSGKDAQRDAARKAHMYALHGRATVVSWRCLGAAPCTGLTTAPSRARSSGRTGAAGAPGARGGAAEGAHRPRVSNRELSGHAAIRRDVAQSGIHGRSLHLRARGLDSPLRTAHAGQQLDTS